MAIQGTYDGFNILDISNPANQATSDDVDKRLFFLDSPTGAGLGSWTLPRPQTATENCTIHNYNVVPSNKGYLLVSGKYQSGISVLDFTHPANAVDGEEPDVPISGGRGFSRVLFSGPLQIPTGGLHLLLINNDGTRAFYALLTDGLGVADVSDFAAGVEESRAAHHHRQRESADVAGLRNSRCRQAVEPRLGVRLRRGVRECHGIEPRVPVGMARMIDISDPTDPSVEARYRVKENLPCLCHAGGRESVTLVVNGGGITYDDARRSVRLRRPVVVLAGTGRTADKLAAAAGGWDASGRSVPVVRSPLARVLDVREPEALASVRRAVLSAPGEGERR